MFPNRMNTETKQVRGLLVFLAGIGGMCGSGYEYALHVLGQSDTEALAGDLQRIGQDWQSVLEEVQDRAGEEQGKQVALNFPADGLDE